MSSYQKGKQEADSRWEAEKARQKQYLRQVNGDIETLLREKTASFKWIAGLISDFMTLEEKKYAESLNGTYDKRKHERAFKITELRQEKKRLIEENRILRYELENIKGLLPVAEELDDYDGMPTQEYDEEDPVKKWLTKDEYNSLSVTERNQLAPDHYKLSRKSNWQLGRDFEAYVGYCLEQKYYSVEYFGMEKKLNDLGRDLIASNEQEILVIQCKYWSKSKTIHEKHIAQLFGTTVKYKMECRTDTRKIRPLFVTKTAISDEAARFATELDVEVWQHHEMGDCPIIKCNIGKGEFGETTLIYHLPMDQQYDKVVIGKGRGERYAFTVREAEAAGFRRAFRWHGETS
jgi:hypothetical protein